MKSNIEQINIGDSYKVIQLEKFGGKLTVETRQFRELGQYEVLVKIMCATIHPADMFFLAGQYGASKPQTPLIPGLEGSGVIIQVGTAVDPSLVGKRCGIGAFAGKKEFEGVWAQYHYTTQTGVMIFDSDIEFETICFAIGNPLTAVGFLDTLRKKGVTCVGQNGASSAVGKIFIKLCKREGIKTINVVRKQEYVEQLKQLGADFVLNSSDPLFDKHLKQTLEENNVKDFFDCVGGDMTSKIMSLSPPESTIYHFGNLEHKRLGGFSSMDFIFYKKVLKGWWVSDWITTLSTEEVVNCSNYIIQDLQKGSEVFKTTFSKSFTLEEIEKAFEYYTQNMTEGKVIIRPNEQ